MCGIVAYINKWKQSGFLTTQQKIFDQLLLCDMLRGQDATGIIAVEKTGDFHIMKEASDAYVFRNKFVGSTADKAMFQRGVALIGHNRAKTVGENVDMNAHPFVEEDTFAMVHNGTLRNHKTMHDTDVDSHALTILFKQAMDQEDWKKAMEEALGKIQGAFACIWYDQKRHQICVIRNSERPMSLVETQSGFVLASEGALAQWICIRNSEKILKVEVVDTMTLYTFDMEKAGGDFSKTFLSPSIPLKGFANGTQTASTAPTVGANPAIGDPVGTAGGRALLSKSAFKKLKPLLWAQTIKFWVADYVDTVNDNQGRCVNALLMGESLDGAFDLCEVNHEVRANVELKGLGLRESDLYGSVMCKGKVYDVVYDKDNCRAIVRVDNVTVEEVVNEVLH